MTTRVGDWIQTYTGRQFWPLSPDWRDVDIEDIAHALSMLCRYNGHCARFYSVAEHSLLVADLVGKANPGFPERELAALLHDASEAYLADVPRPVKPFLEGYEQAEYRVQATINDAFYLDAPVNYHDIIKPWDTAVLVDEMQALMRDPPMEWRATKDHPPTGVNVVGWVPPVAKTMLLERFEALQRQVRP